MSSRLAALAVFSAAIACGQMRDNRDKTMTCGSRWSWDRAHYCEIREQTIARSANLTVDGSPNGEVSVKGWKRNDVLVRTRVESWADRDSEAKALAGRVQVEISGGRVHADGPENDWHSGWAASYEVFVPQSTNLNLTSRNGGVRVSDVRGHIEAQTQNGGVSLARVAGGVTGETQNGGVRVELMGKRWDGRQLDLKTTNGGVIVSMPQNYSAHIQAETVNGGVWTDFPVTVHGRLRPRNIEFNIGSGGPPIQLSTVNGRIRIQREAGPH